MPHSVQWFAKRNPGLHRSLSLLILTGLFCMMLLPSASACDAEAGRMIDGRLPITVLPIPNANKMAAIEEAGYYADVAHYAAREKMAEAYYSNVTEQDVINVIIETMVEAGADEDSFDTIVASGTDSAIPHGDYSNDDTNLILPGEVIVIDLGARVDGWVSDETRTYVLEPVPENFSKVYEIVLHAHDISAPLLVHGTPAWQIDKVARDYITEQGYGEYFTHGLGHGVGVCVHERPLLSQMSSFGMPVSPNQDIATVLDVVTIEPGIYLPNQWGIRIEDDYRVLDDKSVRFTHTPDNLSWAIIKPTDYQPAEPVPPKDDDDDFNWGIFAMMVGFLVPILGAAAYIHYENKPLDAEEL